MKYVGIVNKDGSVNTMPYAPEYVGGANNDMLRDERVENFKTGFNTQAEALAWANAQ